jgi:hypothetical protein
MGAKRKIKKEAGSASLIVNYNPLYKTINMKINQDQTVFKNKAAGSTRR